MSKKVLGVTTINNREILLQTLTEMGLSPKESNENVFTWGQGFSKISVDLNAGKISYDDMRKSDVEKLEQAYSKNNIIAEIRKKGHRVDSVNQVGDTIEIIAGY